MRWRLPGPCFLCGATQWETVCAACWNDLPKPRRPCAQCGQEFLAPDEVERCGECSSAQRYFDQSFALLRYEMPVETLIVAAKFHRNLNLLTFLGQRLAARAGEWPRPDGLIPVPMHPTGLRERGFNQSLLLARTVARDLALPLAEDGARCVKAKQRQSSLRGAARWKNTRGVFAPHQFPETWRHVALVDDVMTTGATVHELAKAVRKRGVEEVSIWCCARA